LKLQTKYIKYFAFGMSGYQSIPDSQNETAPPALVHPKSACPRSIAFFFALFLSVAAVIGVVFFGGIIRQLHQKKSLKLYQTSEFHGDRLSSLEVIDLTKRGFDVDVVGFGNKRLCNPTCEDPEFTSKLTVNAEVTYQVRFQLIF